jgi:hypothetical protein
MSRPAVSGETVSKLQALLGELEGQIGEHSDPSLIELRTTVGAALAALYRVSVEHRLGPGFSPAVQTRH